mmetsp:Transcript_19208/g.64888  ORF Transcript_19208/g.64888 Transcript_19208/m.64888 type:complete len:248 (+) Transcript_19208:667-1410(+)
MSLAQEAQTRWAGVDSAPSNVTVEAVEGSAPSSACAFPSAAASSPATAQALWSGSQPFLLTFVESSSSAARSKSVRKLPPASAAPASGDAVGRAGPPATMPSSESPSPLAPSPSGVSRSAARSVADEHIRCSGVSPSASTAAQFAASTFKIFSKAFRVSAAPSGPQATCMMFPCLLSRKVLKTAESRPSSAAFRIAAQQAPKRASSWGRWSQGLRPSLQGRIAVAGDARASDAMRATAGAEIVRRCA